MTEQTAIDSQAAAAFSGNQANAVLALYGISGAGKTNLISTAIDYNWDVFKKITLVYSSDLGGWGNKMLSQIKYGIAKVWYMRNHVDAFATMQSASLGAWPASFLDPETGLTDPGVNLIMPVQTTLRMICQNGHVVTESHFEAVIQATNAICPTCGLLTSAGSCLRVDRLLIKPALFRTVGGRAYDSFTQLNDWGMDDLQQKSAEGHLPTSSQGGSALGSADALREGGYAFGTSSVAQYGFVQNRTYGWLKNIRAIPGHVTPPIATFGVEESKGDDASGGVRIMGPRIAGNAKTSSIPGWVGNCLHVTREPNADGVMRHRVWLVNHMDPRDPRQIPYLAKHRGEPWGMPDYLEDDVDPTTLLPLPWTKVNLGYFYQLLTDQLQRIIDRDAAKYVGSPGMDDPGEAVVEGVDEIVTALPTSGVGSATVTTLPGQPGQQQAPVRMARRARRPGTAAGAAAPVMPPVAAVPLAATTAVAPSVTAAATLATVPAPGGPVVADQGLSSVGELPAPSSSVSSGSSVSTGSTGSSGSTVTPSDVSGSAVGLTPAAVVPLTPVQPGSVAAPPLTSPGVNTPVVSAPPPIVSQAVGAAPGLSTAPAAPAPTPVAAPAVTDHSAQHTAPGMLRKAPRRVPRPPTTN